MTVDPPAIPANAERLPVQDIPATPDVILVRLRSQFPGWGFLHDPSTGMWTALRGTAERGITIRKPDALTLRLAVEAASARWGP